MANGYETGDYLSRFLSQLPQIYQMQQNAELQRERFEYLKAQDANQAELSQQNAELQRARFEYLKAQDANQAEILRAKNELEREKFNATLAQRAIDNKYNEDVIDIRNKEYDYTIDQAIDAQLKGTPAYSTYLQSKYKDNPEVYNKLREHDIGLESLQNSIHQTYQVEPEEALPMLRRLAGSRFNTVKTKKEISDLIKDAESKLTVTFTELQNTAAYDKILLEEARLESHLNQPRDDNWDSVRKEILRNIQAYKEEAISEVRAGEGRYPGMPTKPFYEQYPLGTAEYDDIEDIPDEEVDKVLGKLGDSDAEAASLPEEFRRPDTPITLYRPEMIGDVEAITPEQEAEIDPFRPLDSFADSTADDIKKSGSGNVLFDKGINRWVKVLGNTVVPATAGEIKTAMGKKSADPESWNQLKRMRWVQNWSKKNSPDAKTVKALKAWTKKEGPFPLDKKLLTQ